MGPLCVVQVMQTQNMLYLVSEYATHGEIFGTYAQLHTFVHFITLLYVTALSGAVEFFCDVICSFRCSAVM